MGDITVYLSGEIHTDWRDHIRIACDGLPIRFVGPVTDHASSDDCGVRILGEQADPFWHDHVSAKVNAIRNRHLLSQADVVVVRFGDRYKQWNAAFEAGQAAASGTTLITLHADEHRHALKEIDATALATCSTPAQVADTLRYILTGELPG
ncbi:MAG: YtoQ family protein [Planctomycetota bacterium]